jgi:hypothetical protein
MLDPHDGFLDQRLFGNDPKWPINGYRTHVAMMERSEYPRFPISAETGKTTVSASASEHAG